MWTSGLQMSAQCLSVPGPGLIITDAGADSGARQVPAVPQPSESTGNKMGWTFSGLLKFGPSINKGLEQQLVIHSHKCLIHTVSGTEGLSFAFIYLFHIFQAGL